MSSSFARDYYDLLGLERNAHSDDIKSAYRAKARLYHPDKAAASTNEENSQFYKDFFNQLQVAYHTLLDPELRNQYDNKCPTKQALLSIEADETFKAFDILRKYRGHEDILDFLPRLEKEYGEVSFKEGVSCIPEECFSFFISLGTQTHQPKSSSSLASPHPVQKNSNRKLPQLRNRSQSKASESDMMPIKKEASHPDSTLQDKPEGNENDQQVKSQIKSEIKTETDDKMEMEPQKTSDQTDPQKSQNTPSPKVKFENQSPAKAEGHREKKNVSVTEPDTSQKKIIRLLPLKPTSSTLQKRVLLCQKHKYLHVCDSECSTTEKCAFWAQYLAYQWMKVNVFSWQPHESRSSHPPGMKYWFNPYTGQAVWNLDDWVRRSKLDAKHHHCAIATCSGKFYPLDSEGSLWVCGLSGKAHICTFSQCNHIQQTAAGRIVCWATKKEYESSVLEMASDEFETEAQRMEFAYIKERADPGSRMRRLTYKNDNNREVQVLVPVPWGIDIGEAVESDAYGKKMFELAKKKKEEELEALEEQRRARNEYSSEESESERDDSDASTTELDTHNSLSNQEVHSTKDLDQSKDNEKDQQSDHKEQKVSVWKLLKSSQKTEEIQTGSKTDPDRDLLGREEAYDYVESSRPFYEKYMAPAIDFRDHADEDEGDYRTIGETIEGENGGFETLIEQDEDVIGETDLFSNERMLLEHIETQNDSLLLSGPTVAQKSITYVNPQTGSSVETTPPSTSQQNPEQKPTDTSTTSATNPRKRTIKFLSPDGVEAIPLKRSKRS